MTNREYLELAFGRYYELFVGVCRRNGRDPEPPVLLRLFWEQAAKSVIENYCHEAWEEWLEGECPKTELDDACERLASLAEGKA